MDDGLTDIPGLEVGHSTDVAGATGCTVVLCRQGAVGGVDVRGGAPGTRETDLLRAENGTVHVHGVVLSGGSAYGLATAGGVMRYLEERELGHRVGSFVVPIVPAAILFDLGIGSPQARPGEAEGYAAATAAATGPVEQGSVGVGTGAVLGKALGRASGMKGGVGTASRDLGDGLLVAALVAVNAVGGVVDPETGQLLAGPRDERGTVLDSVELLGDPAYGLRPPPSGRVPEPLSNTTIGVVATTARLSGAQANRLAQVSHDGLAMAIRPCHTLHDGDTLFALATGAVEASDQFNRLCAVAPSVVARAVVNAVRSAESLAGIPSWREVYGHAR